MVWKPQKTLSCQISDVQIISDVKKEDHNKLEVYHVDEILSKTSNDGKFSGSQQRKPTNSTPDFVTIFSL